jgi:hypothetical protein
VYLVNFHLNIFFGLLLALAGCNPFEQAYVTNANTHGLTETQIIEINNHSSYQVVSGARMEQFRLSVGSPTLDDMRLLNMGKFFGVEIREPELVNWQIFENAHVEGLKIKGSYIPDEAWKWLNTIQGFDDDFHLDLTDQVLDENFYKQLNNFLKFKSIDSLKFSANLKEFDHCKVEFPAKFNALIINKSLYPVPNRTPILYRPKDKKGLHYFDRNTGYDLTEAVRYGTLPIIYFENSKIYQITQSGLKEWNDLYCKEKNK